MPEKSLLQQPIDDESLNQSTLATEQMRSLYHSLPVSLLSSIIIALILSISHWQIIGQAEIILWNLLLGCTLLARLILWIFWHNAHQLYSAGFWLNCFRIGVWLTGSAWGATAFLLFAPDDTVYQALLAFSLAGVASGSMTSLTVDKYSSVGFVILAITPLSIIIFIGDGPTAIAMTSMTLLFIFFVIASTTRARHNMEDQLNKNFHLLKITNKLNQKQKLEKIINNAQSIYIGDSDIKSALSALLKETLPLCNSELGFIAQVKKDAEQNPLMCALVFGSHKKEDRTLENFRVTNLPENGEYRNLDNLFGMILRSEKPIISPNLARDMRASTLPPGHPPINNFIGIPIYNGQEKIAILGLANSPLGYTNQTAEELEPILKSIAQFIQTMNHEQQHEKDKAELEASSQQTQTILNDIADGIITISKDGKIQSFNHAAETIFGYRAKHIIGSNISTLMPEPHKSLHDEYIKSHLKTGKKNILGIGREVIGLRRNGDEFPMDLMVSRVFQHGEPLFIGIVRDITEKRRIDGLHSQFITAASKEILGPLNVITEAISLIQNDASTHLPEPLHHAVGVAQNNSVKLQKLMSDLIEVHNLSKGDAPYKLKTQLIHPLIEETLRRNEAYIDIYQCHVTISATEKNLTVHIDSARLHQALTHLLQYSLKLSSPNAKLGIRISEDRNRVKIAIAIAGKKLNDDAHKNLLLYFGTNNKSINQEQYAEGDLGLAIAKEIIEKMHGKIHIENKAEEDYFIVEFLQAAKEF
ncbi:PAS domain S-box protein [Cellvibrio sp. OA-2007]|uniref:PAS domain S-box protein n=1 Tax=Cellvibrio sp. OA-2007 TaxID=529823 RepID=UPI000783EEB7|nr:PAS domain S-box protein [Cellvibrio sp. OA-2007]